MHLIAAAGDAAIIAMTVCKCNVAGPPLQRLRLIKRGVREIWDLTGLNEMLNVFVWRLNMLRFIGKFEGFI
jgi:hypothetical protein